MDIRTKCLIFIGLIIVALVAMYSVIIFKGQQPQQTFPPGTQIEHSVEIEIEAGSERHEIHETWK
ncbi:hypothetical protein HN662_03445 [Candidatus Woesearchaeota archaeon]|nr:hypothetical protein [Candidatus Woesearchaeota archaeon]